MVNTPHFLGYTHWAVQPEYTAGHIDMREQFDFGTDYVNTYTEGDPDYMKYWGDAQVSLVAHISICDPSSSVSCESSIASGPQRSSFQGSRVQ